MEFEKYLYSTHSFVLGKNFCQSCLAGIFKVSIFLFILQAPFFFFGNFTYLGKSRCLEPMLAMDFIRDPTSKMPLEELNRTKVILPEDIVDIRIREREFEEISKRDEHFNHAHFQFSGRDYLVSLNENAKRAHNFTYHNITIDSDCYASTFIGKFVLAGILDFEVILANEIITSMKDYEVHLKNFRTNTVIPLSTHKVKGIHEFSKTKFFPIYLILNLLQIMFALFLVHTITALSLRFFFMYVPIFFFLGTERDSRLQRQIIRIYSWIGLHYHTLHINGKKVFWIFICFYLNYLLFGWLLDAVCVYWDFFLFNKPFLKNISGDFYGLIYWAELFSVLFIRTRTSLKYVPRFYMLLLVMFIYYFQHTVLGFYDLGLTLLKLSVYMLFTYFLLTFEVPALEWNPSAHYTPSLNSPRALYFPIFSLTWNHELPPIWTMFYPLFGRSYFTNNELALVNGNYSLLRSTLEIAQQRNRNEQAFELGALGQNNQIEIDVQDGNNNEENEDTQSEEDDEREEGGEQTNNERTNSNEGNSGQNLIQNEA